MIIGFCGKKGSGKSFYSSYLIGRYGFVELSFARPLKEAVKVIFGLTDKDVEDPIQKEIINDRLNASPRSLMQWLGTDIIREEFNKKFNYSGSIWVDNVKKQIEKLIVNKTNIVISDVRFENEVEMIKSFGGMIINIKGIDENTDGHRSENQILSFDKELINDKSKEMTKYNYNLLDCICL